ncbi:hypothetical protein LCGC14_0224710 [marine sediment metagenome]|uniref:Uncharacterized protein n=1 Tax=marine sediment metagenome TaxID=412755 RepID=A0A0F9UTU0_9ZZZZ
MSYNPYNEFKISYMIKIDEGEFNILYTDFKCMYPSSNIRQRNRIYELIMREIKFN